jgi:hypothetical protein
VAGNNFATKLNLRQVLEMAIRRSDEHNHKFLCNWQIPRSESYVLSMLLASNEEPGEDIRPIALFISLHL